jgi:hypothetical protein
MGKSWFNLILSDDDYFSSESEFQKLFKGIAILPGENADSWSATFYGLNASTDSTNGLELRLYYTLPNQEGNEYITFQPSNESYIFSRFISDRSESVIGESLETESLVRSTETDNLIFMQSGSGLAVKINIPALQHLHEISGNISILDAELILKPQPGSYDKTNPLPRTINVYWTDKKNRIGDQLYDESGESTISGTLVLDNEFKENTYYYASILNYVMIKVNQKEYTDDDLMFLVSHETFSTSFNRIVLMDNELDNSSMQLRLYYLTY